MIKYCDILLVLVSFSKLMLLIKPQMTLKLFFPLPKLFHKPTKLGIGFNVFSLSVVKSNVILSLLFQSDTHLRFFIAIKRYFSINTHPSLPVLQSFIHSKPEENEWNLNSCGLMIRKFDAIKSKIAFLLKEINLMSENRFEFRKVGSTIQRDWKANKVCKLRRASTSILSFLKRVRSVSVMNRQCILMLFT